MNFLKNGFAFCWESEQEISEWEKDLALLSSRRVTGNRQHGVTETDQCEPMEFPLASGKH